MLPAIPAILRLPFALRAFFRLRQAPIRCLFGPGGREEGLGRRCRRAFRRAGSEQGVEALLEAGDAFFLESYFPTAVATIGTGEEDQGHE